MNVVCLGSGNVATHLAVALKAKGLNLIQVWSRQMAHAESLAGKVDARATDNFDLLDTRADVYLIAVKDDAIAEIAGHLKDVGGLVLHTSGATEMAVLSACRHYGVLYPLQTFSKDKALSLDAVPLCLEANSPENYAALEKIAGQISHSIYHINSDGRKVLHLAAVFANNFTNHLYQLAFGLLERHGLDSALLKPLITETALKVQSASPYEAQTGPAKRDDESTMQKHLALLEDDPALQEIYETLSKSIKKTHI